MKITNTSDAAERSDLDQAIADLRRKHRERLARRLTLAPYLRVSADQALEATVAAVGGLLLVVGLGLI